MARKKNIDDMLTPKTEEVAAAEEAVVEEAEETEEAERDDSKCDEASEAAVEVGAVEEQTALESPAVVCTEEISEAEAKCVEEVEAVEAVEEVEAVEGKSESESESKKYDMNSVKAVSAAFKKRVITFDKPVAVYSRRSIYSKKIVRKVVKITGPTESDGFTPVEILRPGFTRMSGFIHVKEEDLM